MHRFGQDLLLWGILAMAWLMGQRELGDPDRRGRARVRVAGERRRSSRVFLLVMVAIALGAHGPHPLEWLVTAGQR